MKGKGAIRFGLTFTTLAFIWVSFSFIVNFHQHKIWGKSLFGDEVLFIKPKNKEKVLASFSKDKQKQSLPFPGNIPDDAFANQVNCLERVLEFPLTHITTGKAKLLPSGLRAPPFQV